jgi:hypothetical protein
MTTLFRRNIIRKVSESRPDERILDIEKVKY